MKDLKSLMKILVSVVGGGYLLVKILGIFGETAAWNLTLDILAWGFFLMWTFDCPFICRCRNDQEETNSSKTR